MSSLKLMIFFVPILFHNRFGREHWPCQKAKTIFFWNIMISLFTQTASELKIWKETRNQKYMFMKVKSETCILFCDWPYYFRLLLTYTHTKGFFLFFCTSFQFQLRKFWVTEKKSHYVVQKKRDNKKIQLAHHYLSF